MDDPFSLRVWLVVRRNREEYKRWEDEKYSRFKLSIVWCEKKERTKIEKREVCVILEMKKYACINFLGEDKIRKRNDRGVYRKELILSFTCDL